LNVSDATNALKEADFSCNVGDWKPRVTYAVDGAVGELSVHSRGKRRGVRSDGAYGDSDVILEVDVERGVAEINLEVV
jgi:hypothetical protein